MILDVGPKTAKHFDLLLKNVRTIIWNGPMGIAEKYPEGTRALVKAIERARGLKVIGGGDTIAFLRRYHMLKGFSHVSTGGGAMLEFLAGKKLPGVEALKR
jgi:phosphoglycerate kinase